MASSSDDDDVFNYRRSYPLHDAAEAGDMETLLAILRPPKKAKQPTMELPAAAASTAGDGDPSASGGGGGEGGVVPMDEEGGEGEGGASKAEGGSSSGRSVDSDGMCRRPEFDLDERDTEGCTPLHVALLFRNLDAVRLLLECGVTTTRRLEGSPPAHIALSVASLGRHRGFGDAALKLLLEHHHEVSVKDDRSQTLLHLAASFGLDDAIATLLQAPGGKDLMDSKERLHYRPLHLAALGGHVGAARALITAGCDTSTTNLHGNTALHLACSKARWDVARVLLDLGKADVAACNKNKLTPAAVALKLGHKIPDTLPELQPGGAAGTGASSSNGTAAAVDCKGGGHDGEGGGKTVVLHHPLCLEHHSCKPIKRSGGDPPPENVKRLEVIYKEDSGVLRAEEFSSLEWDSNPSRAQLADVLRVHELKYVEKLERLCASIPDASGELSHLDGDTAVSHNSFEAALRAAGSVCDAVDRVMTGKNRNAFCAVRPPGHHAGTRGLVTCGNDAQGSHGFCLLNNVAIGAAYARCIHRHSGVDRVAIVDFDVHHGNGTEDIVKALVPRIEEAKVVTPFCQGVLQQVTYKPWLNPEDPDKCLFVSVHGYGQKERNYRAMPGNWFYPGSGETTACPIPTPAAAPGENASSDPAIAATAGAAGAGAEEDDSGGGGGAGGDDDDGGDGKAAAGEVPGKVEAGPSVNSAAERDPLVLDVGMPLPEVDDTPGGSRHRWRDVYRNDILPKLVAFDPDIILVSAGFDAHKKDVINFGYIGLLEEDYEWVTQQLVQVANRCCQGRLVSVLEGGYRIQGGIVSAFGRSVAGHVRALLDGCESRQEWSAADAAWESNFERRLLEERERKRKAKLEQQMQAMEEKRRQLREALLQQQQQQQLDEQAGDASQEGANGDTLDRAGGSTAAVEAGTEQATAEIDRGERRGQGVPPVEGGREGQEPALPSKRRRTNVDYVALQKKLQEEEKSGTSGTPQEAATGRASAPDA